MKRFLLKILTSALPRPDSGDYIVMYVTILTFTPEQEEEYIKWILSQIEDKRAISETWDSSLMEDMVSLFIKEKGIDTTVIEVNDEEKIEAFRTLPWKQIAEQYPDIFIIAGTYARLADEDIFHNFVGHDNFSKILAFEDGIEIGEEVKINNFPNLHFTCERLPD